MHHPDWTVLLGVPLGLGILFVVKFVAVIIDFFHNQRQIQEHYHDLLAGTAVPSSNGAFASGEIYAYRIWILCPNGHLAAPYVSSFWPPGPGAFEADAPPTVDNKNGFYAYRNLVDAKNTALFSSTRVYGCIKMWGTIVEHEMGYRSEFAKIVWLDTQNNWGTGQVMNQVLAAVRKLYDCGSKDLFQKEAAHEAAKWALLQKEKSSPTA